MRKITSELIQNFKNYLIEEGKAKTPKYLSEVLVHDELYKVYPELENVNTT